MDKDPFIRIFIHDESIINSFRVYTLYDMLNSTLDI